MSQERLARLWDRKRPAVMGILNVTPDSFSDGGRFLSTSDAVAHAERLVAEGADIVDVGGESTRPGATPVAEETERARVLPVIAEIAGRYPDVVVSIDTRRASVAADAVAAGASLINDVSAAADSGMLGTASRSGAGIVLMHMRGEPGTMQRDTVYRDVVAEVHAFLAERACAAEQAGIARDRIFLDPGIGFGKDVAGNVRLLGALADLASLGHPVVVGASRKSFIGGLSGAALDNRLPGSLAALACVVGVPRAVVRVHDVAATIQFLDVCAAIRGAA